MGKIKHENIDPNPPPWYALPRRKPKQFGITIEQVAERLNESVVRTRLIISKCGFQPLRKEANRFFYAPVIVHHIRKWEALGRKKLPQKRRTPSKILDGLVPDLETAQREGNEIYIRFKTRR